MPFRSRAVALAVLALSAASAVASAEPARASHFILLGQEEAGAAFADSAAMVRTGDVVVMPVMFVPTHPSSEAGAFDYGAADVAYDCKGRTTRLLNGKVYTARGVLIRNDAWADPATALNERDKPQYSGFALACGLPDAPTGPAFDTSRAAIDWLRTRRDL